MDTFVESPADARRLLTKAAALLRLPTSPNLPPEVLPHGTGLRCPTTGQRYLLRDGVLNLLPNGHPLTVTQQVLTSRTNALAYDYFRGFLMRILGGPSFRVEAAAIQKRLGVAPGDRVLDLACGHGNFTVEWARRAGPDGLVIGLDVSAAMLARAAARVRRQGLTNVLLVRGDALQLPLADGHLNKVNCSGGFHQFPNLQQAIAEIRRVSAAGAILTASTLAEGPVDRQSRVKRWLKRRFDLHCVPLEWLGDLLAAYGYHSFDWSLPGGWFGYASASLAAWR